MRDCWSLLVAIVLVGCATVPLTEQGEQVQEADDAMVAGCRFLGTLSPQAKIGTAHDARRKAINKAAAMGASHIVFLEVQQANAVNFASVTARAYDCTTDQEAE